MCSKNFTDRDALLKCFETVLKYKPRSRSWSSSSLPYTQKYNYSKYYWIVPNFTVSHVKIYSQQLSEAWQSNTPRNSLSHSRQYKTPAKVPGYTTAFHGGVLPDTNVEEATFHCLQ